MPSTAVYQFEAVSKPEPVLSHLRASLGTEMRSRTLVLAAAAQKAETYCSGKNAAVLLAKIGMVVQALVA